jgi:hypothetical protein
VGAGVVCFLMMGTGVLAELYEYEDAFGTTHLTNTPPDERYEKVKVEDTVYKVEQSWQKQNDVTQKLMQIIKELQSTEIKVSIIESQEDEEEDIDDIDDLFGTEVGGGEKTKEEKSLEDEEEDIGLASKRPWFGIQVTAIDRKLQEEYKLDNKTGLLVKDIAVNSPAEKSKVRIGDVITSITDMYNDETTIKDLNDLNKVLDEVAKEDRIRFTINRKSNLYILLLAVGERPSKLAEGEWY